MEETVIVRAHTIEEAKRTAASFPSLTTFGAIKALAVLPPDEVTVNPPEWKQERRQGTDRRQLGLFKEET